MDLKEKLAAVAALYPDREEVFETTDGGLHLTQAEAEAQAKHLTDAQINTHKLPKPKTAK